MGRVLSSANGWFEWLPHPADPKRKQPYYITAANDEPLFFAALAEVHDGLERELAREVGHSPLIRVLRQSIDNEEQRFFSNQS